MSKRFFFLLFLVFQNLQAQQPEKLNASEILQEIQELNFLGSALYVAAHPDDENTRLIAYLSNKINARTAYLSLTRGDGGQNLVGPELRELLGVIRTQELLAARKIDGGEQFFTRANDFGYSKNPEETLDIWNEKEVLKDVIRVIRLFKPDIVVNRFTTGSAGATHGHHTASAILSSRAFALAGDPSVFPDQVAQLGTWKPSKMFFNTSPWFYDSPQAFEAVDKSNFLQINSGVYYPLKGLSNTEIAALSRSQHQSQGFGSTGTRGKKEEYLELIAGQQPKGTKELFAGINTTWSRIKGGKEIGNILNEVERQYDSRDPSSSITGLVQAYALIQELKDSHWKKIKSRQIKKIIAAAAGLYLEAVAGAPLATPGETVSLDLEVINRSPTRVQLESFKVLPEETTTEVGEPLHNNQSWSRTIEFSLEEQTPYTSPYWLEEPGTLGMYTVKNPDFIGRPQTPQRFQVEFLLRIEGVQIPLRRGIVYKENNPVQGETYRPFEVVPNISVSSPEDVMVVAGKAYREVPITLKAIKDSIAGTLRLEKPASWSIQPEQHSFGPLEKGEEITLTFRLGIPSAKDSGVLRPIATIGSQEFSKQIIQLDYPHIPVQTIVLPSRVKLVKPHIKITGKRIGYIEGAGDAVPQALEQMGYSVVRIQPEEISEKDLQKFDAVVLGIRAYNTVPELKHKQEDLFQYVHSGGNLVVQYNTNRSLITKALSPFPLHISRDRVTDEKAAVHFIAKDHPVLHSPNKITPADFEGWVQERGLYFPDQWSLEFTPILSMKDPGEPLKQGSLLIAPYGKGHYIYTGLSFFRQFPAGVPGAFRLFANLLSLKQDASPASTSESTIKP